jgi:hypothetical protein
MNLTRYWTCAHRKDHLFSGHVFPRETGSNWAPERLAGDPALAAFVPGRDFHLGNPSADVVPKRNGSKWFKKWFKMAENGSKNGSNWLKMVQTQWQILQLALSLWSKKPCSEVVYGCIW